MLDHKNKTLATFLAFFFGACGIHRFYLKGSQDIKGWLYLANLGLSGSLISYQYWQSSMFSFFNQSNPITFFTFIPIQLAALLAMLEALAIGLTPDDQWHILYRQFSIKDMPAKRSGGWLVLWLVLATAFGGTLTIALIARTTDLLLTGGAFG